MSIISSRLRAVVAALVFGAAAGPACAAQPGPAVAIVHIRNFKYAPTVLTVHAGDRVAFANDDGEAHTVTATDKSFDSEGLDGSATWQHVFSKAGTFSYYCELHPYMKATIHVLPSAEGN